MVHAVTYLAKTRRKVVDKAGMGEVVEIEELSVLTFGLVQACVRAGILNVG